MLLIRTSTCLRPRRAPLICPYRRAVIPRRTFTTQNGVNNTGGDAQSSAASLATIAKDLDQLAPRFEINGDDVEIIHSPADFYALLKVRTSIMFMLKSS